MKTPNANGTVLPIIPVMISNKLGISKRGFFFMRGVAIILSCKMGVKVSGKSVLKTLILRMFCVRVGYLEGERGILR